MESRSTAASLFPAGLFKHWRYDLPSSLVVFLVALPLCMGIAVASGAPVAAGLMTGIVGGLIVGFLAGAPLQVSGPAAGLFVVCAEVIRQHGLPALGIVVLFAGILQFVAGLCRFGQWFRAVSPAVIHGMLCGIGVLILSSQFHVLIDDRPHGHGLDNLMAMPHSLMKGLPLPTWDAPEVREAKIHHLREFGKLHERQGEIERDVQRIVTRHGSKQLHDQEAEQLGAFVAEQQELLEDVRAATEALAASPLTSEEGTTPAIAPTVAAVEGALADLEAHRVETAEQSQAAASEALGGVLASLKDHRWAAKIGVLAVIIIVAWNALAFGRLKLMPAPLLAVGVTTVLAFVLSSPVLYVEVPDNLLNGLTFPSLTVFEDAPFWDLLVMGVLMAAIASAETLLCAGAIDRMQNGPRTNYDRELAAQGIGNMICGLLGALPMTGVIVRSATNVQAGAKTRLSAILHGVWILTFVLLLTPLLRSIPIAALAGILVYTGFRLIGFKGFLRLWKESKAEAFIFLATAVVIVVEDLLLGVVTGIVLSAVKLLVTFSHLNVRLEPLPGGAVRMALSGAATFLRLPVLAAQLEKVPKGSELHVDFEDLDYVDHACLELLVDWGKQHEEAGGQLCIDWGALHACFRGERLQPPTKKPAKPPELASVA